MLTLKQKLLDTQSFRIGVELLTTRGTMDQRAAVRTRHFATDLVDCDQVDWVSITDNAGGNPKLGPMALGKPILYGGKEVLIHLSCKDFNRHGLESEAWQLSSEGFHNILALSGDYPGEGYRGRAKPVFDIDSVGLLTLLDEMNQGCGKRPRPSGTAWESEGNGADFFLGAVTTNFKLLENEVVPQYLKLEKKLEVGARFIIAQIGFDARKSHEMQCYLAQRGCGDVPLIGNVFLLNLPVARFFRTQKIPGVVISDSLLAECERVSQGADRGQAFFLELAAQQIALFRGLGFRGAYLGGVHDIETIEKILEIEASFAAEDWKQFARRLRYSRPDEFFLYAEDPATGLADPNRLQSASQESRDRKAKTSNVTLGYRLSKLIHDRVFESDTILHRMGRKIYGRARDPQQGPKLLRILEKSGKSLMFGCKDCGDCSLPETLFVCPESQCAKNQRNGPCGGTRDGKCEVHDFECIWSIAYDRLKYENRQDELLDHAPVIQDEALRGTSSWANAFLEKDHHGGAASSETPQRREDEHPIETVPDKSEQIQPAVPAKSTV